MSTLLPTSRQRVSAGGRGAGSGCTLAAAVLGFFVITLDAVVVNVALPSIRRYLGGGIAGLQWVVDGYTLMLKPRMTQGRPAAEAVLAPAGAASAGARTSNALKQAA